MRDILFVNACPRPRSRTLELARQVLGRMGGRVREICLFEECPAYLTRESLELRDRCLAAGETSHPLLRYAREFAEADEIVIAAPYWDLSFPAMLKAYLENVSVVGVTFRYGQNGIPMGLCKAKKLCYVTTAGGFIGENDFGFSYVKALSETLFGIGSVTRIAAEGLDISADSEREAMQNAMRRIAESNIQ